MVRGCVNTPHIAYSLSAYYIHFTHKSLYYSAAKSTFCILYARLYIEYKYALYDATLCINISSTYE